MALPEEVATVNLTGTYVNLDGTPTVGYLMFEPSPQILKAAASREFVVPKVMQVNLDEGGAFSIVLPANDDPDVTPVDWTYAVTEAFGARRTYSIEIHIANGATQNIYDLAPVALSNGTWYLQGDRGPAGGAMLHTTGKPADTVGEDGDEALDYSTGILYLKTGSHWDNGSQIGSVTSTPNALVVRNSGGGGEFAQVTIDTAPTAASDAVRKDYADALGTPNNTPSSIVRRDTNGVTSFTEVEVTQQTTVASAVRRDYVDPTITKVAASTPTSTPSTLVSRDGAGSVGVAQLVIDNAPASAASATRKDYVDTADALRVQIAGDLGGTPTAPTVTGGTHHTHLSAQITDATDLNTASVLVKRDAGGSAKFQAVGITASPTANDQATRKDYVDAADALRVQIAGDLGGTPTAPTVTSGTHHTHTSAQVSDAVSVATASMVIKRDAAGRAQVVDPAVAADIATKNYVDGKTPAQATTSTPGTIQIAGDLGGTATAPTVVVGTHHTHTSSQISDATSSATASTLALRDASGNTTLNQLTLGGAAPQTASQATRKDYVDGQIALQVPLTQKGAVNGVATLGADGKLSAAQMPAGSGSDQGYVSVDTTTTPGSATVTISGNWGLTDTGTVYYDPAGAVAAEAGLLVPDADGNGFSVFRPGGPWVSEDQRVANLLTSPTSALYAAMYNQPLLKVRQATTAQSIPSGVFTPVVWDTLDFDTAGGSYTAATSTVKVSRSGYYMINGGFDVGANVGGRRGLRFYANRGGTDVQLWIGRIYSPATGPENSVESSGTAYLQAGDLVRLEAWQESGAAQTLNVASNYSPTVMSLSWMRY